MLSSIFISQTVSAVHEALDAADIDTGSPGMLTVLDQPRLGRALVERGYQVLHIADKAKSLRRLTSARICGRADSLPLGDGRLSAVIATGLGQRTDWDPLLREWSRVVRDRGALVLIDRTSATELTRRALCSGLTEIEQRRLGRTIVTSGRVLKF